MYLCHVFLFLSVFSLSSALFPHVELDRSRVTIDVNTKSGEFDIYIEGKHWFSSGPVFFRAKNKLYTTADGSLVLVGGVVAVAGSGVDVIGPYDTITMRYENDQGEAMIASIKIYESALVFGQTFPIGLEVHTSLYILLFCSSCFLYHMWSNYTILYCIQNTSSGNEDGVITGFPSFRMGEKDRKLRLGYAHWLSFYHMVPPLLHVKQLCPTCVANCATGGHPNHGSKKYYKSETEKNRFLFPVVWTLGCDICPSGRDRGIWGDGCV